MIFIYLFIIGHNNYHHHKLLLLFHKINNKNKFGLLIFFYIDLPLDDDNDGSSPFFLMIHDFLEYFIIVYLFHSFWYFINQYYILIESFSIQIYKYKNKFIGFPYYHYRYHR